MCIHNRVSEVFNTSDGVEAEVYYRLTERFKQLLVAEAPSDLPIALAQSPIGTSPLLVVPENADYLHALNARILLLPDYRERLVELARLLIEMASRQPDGVIAAIMLCPYRYYTAHHAINCALLAARVGQSYALKLDDMEQLVCAALTMNIASVSLQDRMASQEAPPSTSQRQALQAHPLVGSALLREAGVESVLWHAIVLQHHEKKNGQGYPFGLTGEYLEPLAQLLHTLDVVTAKMMPRTYRGRILPQQALGELYTGKLEVSDSILISHLVKIMGIYPPGSFVELADGSKAIVVNTTANAATPRVVQLSRPTERIDTTHDAFRIVKVNNVQVKESYLRLIYYLWSLS
ncbi:HD-GYP domain-containing protein [Chromobacterium haemolyticum]|uniref:HD-GYP domain-containing protein n=1 Tax=Chromobacterium haemolyticum TaxID=394935 RepID=UPI0020CAA4EC|nr:HD domain-containing phosphohydrolase [Chromobacterium haemolyticum]